MVSDDETIQADFNAGGSIDPRVLDRIVKVEREVPGNPGSLHASGRRARGVLEDARRQIAESLGVTPDEVIFTSGGTESDNLAVSGLGDRDLPVLCGSVEHPAVFEPAERRGRVDWPLEPGAGRVDPDFDPGVPVGLVALVHAQNETGWLQPIERAADIARSHRVPLHVDAAQTLGRASLEDVVAVADSIALSMHKAGGPKGCGVSIVRSGVQQSVRPIALGGGQESGLRPGTVAVSLAAAAACVVALAASEWRERAARMRAARDQFVARVGPVGECLTPLDERGLPNTAMFVFDSVRDGRLLLPALDVQGVHASQGSACSSGSPTPPRVLLAMGMSEARARKCVRFSFDTCVDEARATCAATRVVGVIRRLSPRHS